MSLLERQRPAAARAVISRRGAEKKEQPEPRYYGAGCDITLRNEVGFVLDFAFVFSRVEHVERVDYAAVL